MHFDNPLIIFIVIVAGLARWLARKNNADKRESQDLPPPTRTQRAEPQTEEERIRRFMEALGQPANSRPPPPVTPRTIVPKQVLPKLPPMRSPLPPLKTAPPPLPPPIPAPQIASTPVARVQRVFQPAPVKDAGFEVRYLDAAALQDPSRRSAGASAGLQEDLLIKLRSAQGLRSAIVLREIFGPPRSLQTLDPVSGS
ncbi:MAG: hypothetical protein DLM73_17210 [Chthoniobacterales bacterium]|nr:MAG: hypothetical protein DLM73_17210 [Chthoniobacterales bacterium]